MLNKSAVLTLLIIVNLFLVYGFKISDDLEDNESLETTENEILQQNKSDQNLVEAEDDLNKKSVVKSRIDALELQYYHNNIYKIADELKRNHHNKHQKKPEDDLDGLPTIGDKFNKRQYLYLVEPSHNHNRDEETEQLGSWSVIWYVASFGGLIAFFLVVSCSEWCCRRNIRNNCSRNSPLPTHNISDTPPPSYDQFAPPPYESLCYNHNGEKSEFDIYVVPVHTFGTIMENNSLHEDAPPSYLSAAAMCSNLTESSNGEVPEIAATNPVVGIGLSDCIKNQDIPT